MKIAKIYVADPNNIKGFFNNVIQRTKFLKNVIPEVDSFIVRIDNGFILSLLKGNFRRAKREEYCYVDGIKIRNVWITLTLYDYLATFKFFKKSVPSKKQLQKYISLFSEYDLLTPHCLQSSYLASEVKKKYDIPYVSTWHGSDINVWPFINKKGFLLTKKLIEYADFNFFVSRKLMLTSDKITKSNNKDVLYTGPADIFIPYSAKRKLELRKKYEINTKYVLGFIGNFVPIKNVLTLPQIFKKLQEKFRDISFVIVGDGPLEEEFMNSIKNHKISNVMMLGKREPQMIPDIINCLDILILPSLNEGLPRITLESLSCGVPVVGSNRGGIPEVIGDNNCFDLDDSFINNISERIIRILETGEKADPLSDKFSWDGAIKKEMNIYNNILRNKKL